MTAETMKVARLLPSRGKVYPNPILTEDEEERKKKTRRVQKKKKEKECTEDSTQSFVEGTSFQSER